MARHSELKNLENMLRAWDDVLDMVPDARRNALEAAGAAVRKEVDRQIVSRLPGRDIHGSVRSWQGTTMGSKGGYVRIGPEEKGLTGKGYSTRKVTGYLEHGHKMVLPKRNRYRRFKMKEKRNSVSSESTGAPIVKGSQFYSWSKMEAEKVARMAAENALEQICDALEIDHV